MPLVTLSSRSCLPLTGVGSFQPDFALDSRGVTGNEARAQQAQGDRRRHATIQ